MLINWLESYINNDYLENWITLFACDIRPPPDARSAGNSPFAASRAPNSHSAPSRSPSRDGWYATALTARSVTRAHLAHIRSTIFPIRSSAGLILHRDTAALTSSHNCHFTSRNSRSHSALNDLCRLGPVTKNRNGPKGGQPQNLGVRKPRILRHAPPYRCKKPDSRGPNLASCNR